MILHMGYSAIFAKYVMPIFMIHATRQRWPHMASPKVGFVSRSELAKDYKNDAA